MKKHEGISSYYNLLYGAIDMNEEVHAGGFTPISFLFQLQYNHVRLLVTELISSLKFSISIRIDCHKRKIPLVPLVSLSSLERLRVAEEVLDVVKYL